MLEHHHIWYMASGGTLLGAVRNKGIIPHDDDVDFNIMRVPGSKLVNSTAFRTAARKNGLYVKYVHRDFWHIGDILRPELHVDLMAMIVQDNKVTFAKGLWKGTELPLYILAGGGLMRWPFGASDLRAPRRPVVLKYLNKKYGTNWARNVSCKGAYHKCKVMANKSYDLTQHALPCAPLPEPVLT